MSEEKTVRRWWWVWDYEKEEKWLNVQALEGWTLKDAGFCRYTFEKTEPGEYFIGLEMRASDDKEYEAFINDVGAENCGRCVNWHYYRRKTELGPFEVFSSVDSKLEHMHRIDRMLIIGGCLNLGIGLINTLNGHLGWINLLCAGLLAYALGRINGKEDELKKQKELCE
jgi:Protein of unknown function (DUF2812).